VSRAVASTALLSMAMHKLWSQQPNTNPQTEANNFDHVLEYFGTNSAGNIADRWYEFLCDEEGLESDYQLAEKTLSVQHPSASHEQKTFLAASSSAIRFAVIAPGRAGTQELKLYHTLAEWRPDARNIQGEGSKPSADEGPLARIDAEISNFGEKLEAACRLWADSAIDLSKPRLQRKKIVSEMQTAGDPSFGSQCDAVGSLLCHSRLRYRVLKLETDVDAIFHPKHGQLVSELENLRRSTVMENDPTKRAEILKKVKEANDKLERQKERYGVQKNITELLTYPRRIAPPRESVRKALLSAWTRDAQRSELGTELAG
jgi:hypothetical protein